MIGSKRLLDALERAGVYVQYDEKMDRAATSYDPDRDSLCVTLGKIYLDGDERTREMVLAHEFGHIMRGDLLVDVAPDTRKEWNVASDALINEALDHDVIKQSKGVLYSGLREDVPTLPEQMPDRARPIYDELVRQRRKDEQRLKELLEKAACGLKRIEDPKAREAAARALARAIAAARDLGIPGMGSSLEGSHNQYDGPIPPPNNDITRIVSAIQNTMRAKANQGLLTRQRSYARPGRVEGLRGVVRRRRLKLVVLADVSGSMVDTYQRLVGALSGVEREHDVLYIAWSDEAEQVRKPMDVLRSKVLGGGTVLQPALDLANRLRPDAALIVTDAQISDLTTVDRPPYPVFWAVYNEAVGDQAWTPFGRVFQLRPQEAS